VTSSSTMCRRSKNEALRKMTYMILTHISLVSDQLKVEYTHRRGTEEKNNRITGGQVERALEEENMMLLEVHAAWHRACWTSAGAWQLVGLGPRRRSGGGSNNLDWHHSTT
jgi:hypothetical protein